MALAQKEGKLHRERQFMIGIPASEMQNGPKSEELVLIQGVIDAYIEEEDGFILIDYKTDRVPKEGRSWGKAIKRKISGTVRLLWKGTDPAYRQKGKRKVDLLLWIEESSPVKMMPTWILYHSLVCEFDCTGLNASE